MLYFGRSVIFVWIKRTVAVLFFLELLYLGLFNYLLNSDSFKEKIQTLASDFGPGELEIMWDKAWTLYPGSIHVDDLQLSGLAHGRKWEGSAHSLEASIAVSKLFSHSLKFSSLVVKDLDYRSKKEESVTTMRTSGEDTAVLSGTTRKGSEKNSDKNPSGRKWDFELGKLKIYGKHYISSSKIEGRVDGTLEADTDFSLREHRLQVKRGTIELQTDLLHSLSGDPIVKFATMGGGFRIVPLDLGKEKGRALLKFLVLDMDLEARMQTLKVFDRQLHALRGIDISGSGELRGHIGFSKGKFLPTTKIDVQAKEMHLWRDPYEARGDGTLLLTADKGKPAEMNLNIAFGQYQVSHTEGADDNGKKAPLFSGNGLVLETGLPITVKELEKAYHNRGEKGEIALKITAARIGDLRILAPYFSRQIPVELLSGSAVMNADLHWKRQDLQGVIGLHSDDLHLRIDDRKLSALLKANIMIDHGDIDTKHFDISGTTLTIEQVKVDSSTGGKILTDDWNAGVTFDKGIVIWEKPLKLKSVLHVVAKDSSPFLALVENGKFQFSLISRFLLVQNLQGSASIEMDGNRVWLPMAKLKGGRLRIETKAVFAPDIRSGAVLFRHSNIRAFVGIEKGKVDLDIFNAQKRFDGFRLPLSAPSK